MKIHRLMKVTAAEHDIAWLKEALQAAIDLELSTLPPYLCGMWSIKDESSEAYGLIKSVALDEMAHMALCCNMLTAIGGQPRIRATKYPGPLPGGVRPQLEHVALVGLTRDVLKNTFMEIEYPEHGPIAMFLGMTYPTIGEFYDALLSAFQELSPSDITGNNQLESFGDEVFAIRSVEDAKRAIEQIKEQGEGTSSSPHGDDFGDELAHYYKFAEIYHGRRLIQHEGDWVFKGDPVPFPDCYPMAEVPAGGYPAESKAFDTKYTTMLKKLEAAWNGDPGQLNSAVGDMFGLKGPARELMQKPIPGGEGNFGPSFLWIEDAEGPSPPDDGGDAVTDPTFERDIKPLFTGLDIAHMRPFGVLLDDYDWMAKPSGGQAAPSCGEFADHANARTVFGFITGECQPQMPPGNPWSQERRDTYQAWMDGGFKKGVSTGGGGGNGGGGGGGGGVGLRWRETNAPVASSRTDDIWFHDPDLGWAVNSNGEIVKTEDGGATWATQFQANVYWRCIGFANSQKGWAGTLTKASRMFATDDGGETWKPVALPEISPVAVCGLSVVSESVVWASGTNYPFEKARVVKSVDGGKTWEGIDMGEHASNLIDCYFPTKDSGWVVGGFSDKEKPDYDDVKPVVLFTEDGGNSWVNQVEDLQSELPTGEWGWKIQFLTAEVGFISLENLDAGAILKTINGGKSWRRIPINDPQGNANLEGVGFIDQDHGWVGGWGNRDFTGGFTSATTDGGENWQDANQVGKNINRFRFFDDPDTKAYASGKTVYKYSTQPISGREVARALVVQPRALKTGDRELVSRPVSIEYELPPRTKHVQLQIWNHFGREISKLLDEENPTAGRHVVTWAGTDDSGNEVSEGIYIYRLTVDGSAESRMIRLRD